MNEIMTGIPDLLILARRRISSLEQGRGSMQMYDLTDADPDILPRLREKTTKAGGRASIIVHPFFRDPEELHRISPEYTSALQGMILEADSAAMPIIIFEEEREVASLKYRIRGIREIFLVRTKENDPTPITARLKAANKIEDPEHCYTELVEAHDMAFSNLMHLLSMSGIKTVDIAGRLLLITDRTSELIPWQHEDFEDEAKGAQSMEEWIRNGIMPYACVGKVIREVLKCGMDVRVINAAVGPNNPSAFLDRNTRGSISL